MAIKSIAHKIFREVKDWITFYLHFLPNYTPNEIIKNVEKYLKQSEKCYKMEVVDIIIGAAANALNVNIRILQNSQGFKNVLEFQPTMWPSISTIFLMLEKDAQPEKDPNNINSHYNAVVLRENNSQTKSSGTCGTLAAGPKGVHVKQEPIEIIEVDSDSGDFEIVDSQPIPGKSVQTKSACNTQQILYMLTFLHVLLTNLSKPHWENVLIPGTMQKVLKKNSRLTTTCTIIQLEWHICLMTLMAIKNMSLNVMK